MILAGCIAVALWAAAAAPADVPVLIRFHHESLEQLPGWDGSLEKLQGELTSRWQLPAGAKLRESALARMQRAEAAAPDFARWMILALPATPDGRAAVESLVQRLKEDPLVEQVELDHEAAGWKPKPVASHEAQPGTAPDDPLFSQQYYLHQIHAPEAWEITTGSPEVIVAVLDSGFDLGIEDLAGRVEEGYDFVAEGPIEKAGAPHGTAMAAIIAAAGNNGRGIAGMAWQCRILPVQMSRGGTAAWAQAIDYAVSQGADVINISGKLDLPAPSPILEAALENAVKAGITVVASAGNQDRGELAWPAKSPQVIAVGATDGFHARWRRPLNVGSNYGEGLDLVAPGASIVTLSQDGDRSQGEGTSPAAALVSGTCALMLAVNPQLKPGDIRELLHRTAEKIGPADTWREGRSEEFGAGLLNVLAAVEAARADQTAP